MEVSPLLQFSIAVFTAAVVATLVPSVRKSIPGPIEVVLWTALVFVCVIGALSITNPQARELTSSAFWGVDQVINTLVALLGAGLVGWISDNRSMIATWVVLGWGADILALAMLRSYRKSEGWQPRVRLAEWMELPRLPIPSPEPVVVPYVIDELNRKWAAGTAVAGAALLSWLVNFSIRARDVLLPRAAERFVHAVAAGRVESRARLESLRETASQLQFGARAGYVDPRVPAINGLAVKATEAVHVVSSGQHGRGADARPGPVVDIHVLLSAQSIGWYGPLRPAPTVPAEEDEDEEGQTDRLAS